MSRSPNRIPFHVTVPPQWLEEVRQAAADIDLSMTSFLVCLTSEALRRGQAEGLAADGAARHPEWVKSAAKPPSKWKTESKGVATFEGYTIRLKPAKDETGPRGWYLEGPRTNGRYLAVVRAEAEELANGFIHRNRYLPKERD